MRTSSIIPYPGSSFGKSKILNYIPKTADKFVSVFAGSAGTYLRACKEGGQYRYAVLNDINPMVTNFFKVMSHPTLRRELFCLLRFTLYAEETLREAEKMLDDPTDTVRAWAFVVLCNMSRYPFDDNTTFKRQYKVSRGLSGDKAPMTMNPTRFLKWVVNAKRHVDYIRGAMIENMDYKLCIEKYAVGSDTFVFADPPFHTDGRLRTRHYLTESGADNTEFHVDLYHALNCVAVPAMVIGYATPFLVDLYAGWTPHVYSSRVQGGATVDEIAWLNGHLVAYLENGDTVR